MIIAIIVVVVLVALGLVFWFSMGGAVVKAGSETLDGRLHDPHADALRYRLPAGQDPAVPVVALKEAGYPATADLVRGDHVLTVACPDGQDVDRSRIRTVLEDANRTSLEGPRLPLGPVVFEDER